ncbi:ABC transporter substrate-binding protein [Pseudomonas sp. NPDC089407]|uniref:ABC transporter substrate-binding protein n=1 Tax=Pseudomonas sp. NPDC089407 TaxID=3364464 RepID=UPI00384EF9F0
MVKINSALCVSLVLLAVQSAEARDLTVVSFGGALKDAQAAAFVKPYMESFNTNVILTEYNGELSKVKAMVDTRSVNWDVVEVEDTDAVMACDLGLFEELDYSKIGNEANFIEGAALPCAVGTHAWSTVLAYNSSKIKEAPKSWADFWDLKKFPGKRSLRKTARGSLEFALMADGVPVNEVYNVLNTPEGVDRAFKKLDQIKPNLQWWESGAQPPQYLVSGDVVMSSAYSGRIAAAKASGATLDNTWNQNLLQMDLWMIPKGSDNVDAAYKFIKFASDPNNQVAFSNLITYGPTTHGALERLSPQKLAELPSSAANVKHALKIDVAFWTDHGESLEQRFISWAAK